MSTIQIVNYAITVLQQFGVVPYIGAGLVITVVIATIAMVRRSLSNA